MIIGDLGGTGFRVTDRKSLSASNARVLNEQSSFGSQNKQRVMEYILMRRRDGTAPSSREIYYS